MSLFILVIRILTLSIAVSYGALRIGSVGSSATRLVVGLAMLIGIVAISFYVFRNRAPLSRLLVLEKIILFVPYFGLITGVSLQFGYFEEFYMKYYIVDFIVMWWILSCVLFFSVCKIELSRLVLVVLVLVGVDLMSNFKNVLFPSNDYVNLAGNVDGFIPTVGVAIIAAGASLFCASVRVRAARVVCFVLFCSATLGAILSYQRALLLAVVLICLIVPFAVITALGGSKFSAGKLFGGFFVVSLFLVGAIAASPFLEDTRLYATFENYLLDGELDVSSSSRLYEASDAFEDMSGSVLALATGFGHGATYEPKKSSIYRNFTREGLVHNIHIGPVLLYFRYGILGIALYAYLLIVLWKSMMKICFDLNGKLPLGRMGEWFVSYFFFFVFFIGVVRFCFQNTLIDPLFGFSLGIVVLILKSNFLLGRK